MAPSHETGHPVIPGFFPVAGLGSGMRTARRPPGMRKIISHLCGVAPTAEPGDRSLCRPSAADVDGIYRPQTPLPGQAGGSRPFKNLKGRAGNRPSFPSICWTCIRYPQSTSAGGWAVSRTRPIMDLSRRHVVGHAISGRSRGRMTRTASSLRPDGGSVNRN